MPENIIWFSGCLLSQWHLLWDDDHDILWVKVLFQKFRWFQFRNDFWWGWRDSNDQEILIATPYFEYFYSEENNELNEISKVLINPLWSRITYQKHLEKYEILVHNICTSYRNLSKLLCFLRLLNVMSNELSLPMILFCICDVQVILMCSSCSDTMRINLYNLNPTSAHNTLPHWFRV